MVILFLSCCPPGSAGSYCDDYKRSAVAMRATDTTISSKREGPVSPSSTRHFGKSIREQISGKSGSSDARYQRILFGCLATGSQLGIGLGCVTLSWYTAGMDRDDVMMGVALDEARSALAEGHLPVGAVLALDGRILGRARKAMGSNHLDNAEMVVFRQVFVGDYTLTWADSISLYTTLEPCIMCWGTLRHLPIRRLVYAMPDAYGGCAAADLKPSPPRHLSRPLEVVAGVRQQEARELFQRFLDTTTEEFWVQGGAPEFVAQVLYN